MFGSLVLGAVLSWPAPLLAVSVPATPVPQESRATADDASLAVQRVMEEYDKAVQDLRAENQRIQREIRQARARGEEPERPAIRRRPDGGPFAERLMEIAKANRHSQAALTACQNALGLAPQGEHANAALNMLMADFSDSEAIGDIAAALERRIDEQSQQFLEKLLNDSPHRSVRAMAAWSRAQQLDTLANMTQRLDTPGRGTRGISDELRKQLSAEGADKKLRSASEAMLEMIVNEYDDINNSRGQSLAKLADAQLFEVRNLRIGCQAPEIEGKDAEDVAFKLSDYRGQVVVIDFWGFW